MLYRRKQYRMTLLTLAVVIIAGCSAGTENAENDTAIRIAGNYICFDENAEASLKKSIITVDGEKISAIDEYRDHAKDNASLLIHL